MSFFGKKFRRTRHENFEELLKAENTNEDMVKILQGPAPTFCFKKLQNDIYNYTLEMSGRHMTFDFTLGEETEIERRDGERVKITITMPDENLLHQKTITPSGKIIYFTRQFYEKEAKMTVTMEETDVQAFIYFEMVE